MYVCMYVCMYQSIGTSSVTLAPSALRTHTCMQCVSMEMFITGPGKKLCAGGGEGGNGGHAHLWYVSYISGLCHTSLECVIHLYSTCPPARLRFLKTKTDNKKEEQTYLSVKKKKTYLAASWTSCLPYERERETERDTF